MEARNFKFVSSSGNLGATGYTGDTGPPGGGGGSTGWTGYTGYTGADGLSFTGATGYTGYTGEKGADGLSFTGSTGYTGEQGATGWTGEKGADGNGITGSAYFLNETQPIGTNGGSFLSGSWVTRTLNTLIKTPSAATDVSLAVNAFTLQNGLYSIFVKAPAYRVGNHQCRLYNLTDATPVQLGTSQSMGTSQITTISTLEANLEITTPKTFIVQHQCTSTRALVGLGWAAGISNEIYTTVEIVKYG